MSIYDDLGQEVGIRTAVDDFYERVLADPHLRPYFEGVDMNRLRGHQTKLLVQVTGGPVAYEGRDLAAAHDGLHITDADFDRVVGHLAGSLTDLGVEQSTIAEVGSALSAYRADIVSPGPVT